MLSGPIVDLRKPHLFNSSDEEEQYLKQQDANENRQSFIVRLHISGTGIVNRLWYHNGLRWEKFDQLEPYRYKYTCPYDSSAASFSDGVDENGEICLHCQGVGML